MPLSYVPLIHRFVVAAIGAEQYARPTHPLVMAANQHTNVYPLTVGAVTDTLLSPAATVAFTWRVTSSEDMESYSGNRSSSSLAYLLPSVLSVHR